MSVISIKRHNHRVHSCEKSRKQELLQHLITLYAGKSILVISNANTTTTEIEDKNLTLSNDNELAKMEKRRWDLLISFDLPTISADYLSRLPHAKEMALILIDDKEETQLYPIETLVGKNLPREIIPGFESRPVMLKREEYKPAPHRPTASQQREEIKETAKKEAYKQEDNVSQRNHRYSGATRSESEKRADGKPQFKKSGEKKPWENKDGDKKPYEKKAWDKPQGDKKPWDKKDGDKKPYEKKAWDKPQGDKKPWENKDGDKKPYEKKAWDKPQGDKKPWDKKDGDKKPYEKKAWDKPQGDKKPWENKPASNDYRNKKETTHTSSQPKRVPRVIKIPSESKTKES